MAETRIPLDGWVDDAGQEEFVVEAEADLVRIELPSGLHDLADRMTQRAIEQDIIQREHRDAVTGDHDG